MTLLPSACEVAIVGGGIAGLAAAWELREHDVVVLEAQERVGGRIRSEPAGEYWLNFGAHLFPEPGGYLGRLIAALGLESSPVRGTTTAISINGKTVTGSRLEAYPLRLRLPPSARLSMIRLGLRLRSHLADYGRSAAPLAYREGATFADLLGRLHPEVKAIVEAAVNRVGADPTELSAAAGLALFEFAGTLGGRKDMAHRRNIVGGSALLPYAIADELGDRVLTGARVTSVRQGGDAVEIGFERDGRRERVRARSAIVAVPAPAARRVLRDAPDDLTAALGRIAYGPYVVGAVHTCETGPMPWDDVYAMVTPKASFNMFFNTASVKRTGPRRPGGTLMVYGGGELARGLMDKGDAEIADAFVRDLEAIYPKLEAVVDEVRVHRWVHGIPFARPGRGAIQEVLERPVGRIFLAGDYTAAFADMEAAAESGVRAARGAAGLVPSTARA